MVNFDTRNITDGQLLKLFMAFPRVTSWNFRNYTRITDQAIEYLTTFCKGVVNLDFYGFHELTDKGLTLIADHLPDLESLILDTNSYLEPKFSDSGLIYLLSNCKKLKRLQLSNNHLQKLFTSWFYKSVSKLSFPLQLEHFTNLGVFYDHVYRPNTREIISLLEACPKLKNIDIIFDDDFRREMGDTEKLVQTLVKSCPFVEHLKLHSMTKGLALTQEELQNLLNMPHLQELTIPLFKRDFDPIMLKKAPHCKRLCITYFGEPTYYWPNTRELTK